MKPFAYPPLKILVHRLDGVEDRPYKAVLLPEDIREDALYQTLARRNKVLEWRQRHIAALVTLVSIGVIAINVLYSTSWVQSRIQYWTESVIAMVSGMRVEKVASSAPVTTPTAASAPAELASSAPSAAVAQSAPTSSAIGTSESANQLAAALRLLIEQHGAGKPGTATGGNAPMQTTKPITVVPGIRPGISTAKPAIAPERSSTQHAQEPATLTILDFFGANTAVLLSPDGGQSMRSYRVGDALPSGEVIRAIDSTNGSVTTNQRIIKRQDQK